MPEVLICFSAKLFRDKPVNLFAMPSFPTYTEEMRRDRMEMFYARYNLISFNNFVIHKNVATELRMKDSKNSYKVS